MIYTVCKGRVYPGSAGQELILCFIEIHVFIVNSGNPDQTHTAGSDLILYCLPITFLGYPN